MSEQLKASREFHRELVEVGVRKERPFTQDLEERFKVTLGVAGNSEAKLVTLLVIGKEPVLGPEIHRRFLEVSNGVWQTDPRQTRAFCVNDFVPNGLVAQTEVSWRGTTRPHTAYAANSDALQYVYPTAAYLLKQSTELPYSLGEIFGQTASSGEIVAAVNRARILQYLYQQQFPSTILGVTHALGIPSAGHRPVSNALIHLDKLGLVDNASAAVSITPSGRELVSHILIPVRRALAGDEALLLSWRQIPWQNYAVDAVTRNKAASPHAFQGSLESTVAKALYAIQTTPGIRAKEIIELVGLSGHQGLKMLLAQGLIGKRRYASAVRYYPQGEIPSPSIEARPKIVDYLAEHPGEKVNLTEIGRVVGVSTERVRQIYKDLQSSDK